ncbi:YolD-like family protein [Brevibacillus centrosporus]|uniref:YolD-like family protein n=1 Tax=Brevibacillus centrosporus TaxID=54910 RepID=UPI0011432FA6|nr:YolD-like family protein [Brevibacillus centrosporus]MEC2127858.1 YolD-like family protein [Brevibacillus centrosporus]GED32098.1 hypothetical protein BCE02nite_32390 [Brevibacillus centrosporus]
MARKIDNLFQSVRFVLPQQRELYLELKRDEQLIPKPVLEEDELEEIQRAINDSRQGDYAVTVSWWSSVKNHLGCIHTMWGVARLNPNTRKLKLMNDTSVEFIDIGNIVSVS